jgi:hypothetical protein
MAAIVCRNNDYLLIHLLTYCRLQLLCPFEADANIGRSVNRSTLISFVVPLVVSLRNYGIAILDGVSGNSPNHFQSVIDAAAAAHRVSDARK